MGESWYGRAKLNRDESQKLDNINLGKKVFLKNRVRIYGIIRIWQKAHRAYC